MRDNHDRDHSFLRFDSSEKGGWVWKTNTVHFLVKCVIQSRLNSNQKTQLHLTTTSVKAVKQVSIMVILAKGTRGQNWPFIIFIAIKSYCKERRLMTECIIFSYLYSIKCRPGINTSIGVRAGGARGAAASPNFGQLRFFGQQEKIWAKLFFKDVSVFFISLKRQIFSILIWKKSWSQRNNPVTFSRDTHSGCLARDEFLVIGKGIICWFTYL